MFALGSHAVRAAGILLLSLPAFAGQFDSGKEFRWSGQIAAGGEIEIKGVNGDIAAERATSGRVEVSAVKQGRRSDPESVRVEVVEHAGGVTICAVYPSQNGRPNVCAPGSGGRMNVQNNDVRVTFTVRAPAGVAFVGRTVNGNVEAASLASDVEAHTVNGSLRISTTEHAKGGTVNGSITAVMGRSSRPSEFNTVNGAITLELPSGTGANLDASTVNGNITSDFEMTVRGKIGRRHVTGAVGGGGPDLRLKTVNGSIRLRRS